MKPLPSPRLNACQEYGVLAGRLHAKNFFGGLDISNCIFEADGTLKAMVSTGRGRILDRALTLDERANDLAGVKKVLEPQEWEAFKLGYGHEAPNDAAAILSRGEPRSADSGPNADPLTTLHQDGKKAFEEGSYDEAEKLFAAALEKARKLPTDDPRLAMSFHYLGKVYAFQGKTSEAIPLVERSLALWQEIVGAEHHNVAAAL